MGKNYKLLTESIKSRINPEEISIRKSFSDELATISYSEVLTYIRTAMKSVEPEYTQKSRDAGEKVKEHLLNNISDVTFRYQGSIMTDTHIKGYSDIDLLTICEKFYTYDSNSIKQILESTEKLSKYSQSSIGKLKKEEEVTPYSGNSLDDLRSLRYNSERKLIEVYEKCDIGKPKAIRITNKSLNRDVDIVIAGWYDDVTSIINDKGEYRGIQIYNKGLQAKERADFPFLSIKRINDRSAETNGRLKRMIRFLKNVKADSEHKIDLSSFDINAICYDIEINKYQSLSFYELIPVVYIQLKNICTDQNKADRIISVDGREYIFKNNNVKLQNLRLLLAEVEGLFIDLKSSITI